MKKILAFILFAACTHYSKAQTCNSLDTTFGVNGRATGYATNEWINVRNLIVQPDGKIVQISSTHVNGFMAVRYNANGSTDNGFGTNGIATAFSGQNTESVRGILQSDGKLVVAGTRKNPSSYSDIALARFNSNGTLDNTFGTGGKLTVSVSPHNSAAQGLAIQPDGKIVVAGYSSGNCITDCLGRQFCRPLVTLLRFNPNGNTDSSFGQNGHVIFGPGSFNSGIASSVLIQPDGKIIALGEVHMFSCATCTGGTTSASGFLMARYLPNGAPDNSFGINGQVMETSSQGVSTALLQPDGRILATLTNNQGGFLVKRYSNNGSVDNTFIQTASSANRINDMLILPDGKLALGGRSLINNQVYFSIMQLKSNGGFDSSFNGTGSLYLKVGVSANLDEGATGLALQGTHLLAGGFIQVSSSNSGSSYSQVVVRLGAAGTGIPVTLSPSSPQYPCTGDTLILNAGTTGAYQWYKDGGIISGATSSIYKVTASGSYAVRVTTGGGCGLSNPLLVQYNALPVFITPLSSLNICNGDSVKLQSNQAGTVQWYKDNVAIAGATNTIYAAKTTGSYYVSIKNASGCGQSLPISVNVISNKPVLQWDGIKFNTVGGYLSYRWYLNGNVIAGATSSSLAPTTMGVYKVTITDFPCDTTSGEFSLECKHVEPSRPVVQFNGTTFSTGIVYAGYQWYYNDTIISGATTQSFKPVLGKYGAYKVTVTNSFGCTNTSEAVSYISQTLNLGNLFLQVYPNPAKEKMMIEVLQPVPQILTVMLYDLQGRRLLQRLLKAGRNELPVYQLPPAVYVLEFRYGKEKSVLKAVVVR